MERRGAPQAGGRGAELQAGWGVRGFFCLLGDIRGVQISSRALQVTLEEARLCQFELLEDSPKRWEDLLCLALRRFYAQNGQRVTEFKPRIITARDRTMHHR